MQLLAGTVPARQPPLSPSSDQMTTLPEITDLFAKLASHLQETLTPSEQQQEDCDYLISKLNRSLNLDEDNGSSVRFLDTALSLMCFKAPQVFDSVIEYTVKTIVTVLSSSISSRVQRIQNEEILQIGSSFSICDCDELIEACTDVIGKLEGYGAFSHSLSYAVVRVLVSASCYRYMYPSMLIYDVKSIDAKNAAVSKLLGHLPKDISNTKGEIPLRLQLWYLDPLTLKHDVSKVLQDYIKRPFLCLNKELYERMDWRSIIVCLVLSPTMFIETRALLHNWFLATGLDSVLQLVINLVTVVLDVVSRPTWWGISVEMGSKLPFSNAYFPYKHNFLRILNGPLVSETFLHIFDIVRDQFSHDSEHWDPAIKQAARKAPIIGHKSSWAMAMNFPEWFLFASLLLFSERSFQDDFNSKCTLGASKSGEAREVKSPVSAAAARYIAWILSPFSQSHQDLLDGFLTKISESWTLKQLSTDTQTKEKTGYRKKHKKPKFHDDKEAHSLLKENDCQIILCWLKEFQDIYIMFRDKTVHNSTSCEGKSPLDPSLQHNVLFLKIPLGILIGCSNSISEDGCDLLLQYAATGSILHSRKTQSVGLKRINRHEDSIIRTEECNREEAVAGACLVFNLTDSTERMSASMFESEKGALDFICRVKVRTSKYLIKCIKKLLQIEIDQEDGAQMLMDLCSRLVNWRHQGRECFEGNKDLDDVIDSLSYKLSSLLGDFV